MRLIDIYSKRMVTKSKGWKRASKFFMNPITKYRFDFLNDIDEPSINDIAEFQKQCAYNIKDQQHITTLLQNINYDILNKKPLPAFSPQAFIEEIEKAFSFDEGVGVFFQKTKQIDSNTLQQLIAKHSTLITQLQNIYTKLKNSSLNNSTSGVIKELEYFEKALNELQHDVNIALSTSTSAPIIFSDRGYLNNLLWLSWHLKGQYLETEGTNFFNSRLPKNIKAVNTGRVHSIYLDLLGRQRTDSSQIIEDIMLFDQNNLAIKIEYFIDKKKKTGSIQDFIHEIENNTGTKTISLDIENYTEIQQNMITGVNAKSGIGNIKFRKVKLDEVMDVRDNFGILFALKSLKLLVTPIEKGGYGSKRILGTNPIYDSLFNYILGRSLHNIIGATNKIMLTRNGFSTVRDFLLEKFNDGYIMGAMKTTPVNIRKPNKLIQVGLRT